MSTIHTPIISKKEHCNHVINTNNDCEQNHKIKPGIITNNNYNYQQIDKLNEQMSEVNSNIVSINDRVQKHHSDISNLIAELNSHVESVVDEHDYFLSDVTYVPENNSCWNAVCDEIKEIKNGLTVTLIAPVRNTINEQVTLNINQKGMYPIINNINKETEICRFKQGDIIQLVFVNNYFMNISTTNESITYGKEEGSLIEGSIWYDTN